MGLYDGWPPTETEALPFTNEQDQAFSDQAHSMREQRLGPPTPRPNTGAECFGPAGASARPRSDYGVRLDKLEASTNDVFRQLVNVRRSVIEFEGNAKIHAVTDPIISGNLSERIEALERQFLRSPDSFDVNNMVGVLNEAIDKLIKRIDIHDKQITELDQSALRAQCAPPIPVDGHTAHFKELYQRVDAGKKNAIELEAKLSNHSTRLINLQDRICEMEAKLAHTDQWVADIRRETLREGGFVSRIEDLAKRVDDLPIDDHVNHIKELYVRLADLSKRVTEEVDSQGNAIDELSKNAGKRLDAIENILRVRAEMSDFIGRYSKKAAELNAGDFSNFGVTYVRPPKPIIKGGWVNAYPNGQMHFHQTREAADNAYSLVPRIACIQIPDITEGEGL